MRRRILAAVGAIALLLPSSAALAASPDDDPASRFAASASHGAVDSSFRSAAIGADGRVTVVIEMTGDPVAVVQAEKGRELTPGPRVRSGSVSRSFSSRTTVTASPRASSVLRHDSGSSSVDENTILRASSSACEPASCDCPANAAMSRYVVDPIR